MGQDTSDYQLRPESTKALWSDGYWKYHMDNVGSIHCLREETFTEVLLIAVIHEEDCYWQTHEHTHYSFPKKTNEKSPKKSRSHKATKHGGYYDEQQFCNFIQLYIWSRWFNNCNNGSALHSNTVPHDMIFNGWFMYGNGLYTVMWRNPPSRTCSLSSLRKHDSVGRGCFGWWMDMVNL